jgi:hypothetical protein
MTQQEGPFAHSRKSGGPWAGRDFGGQEEETSDQSGSYEAVPPEERRVATSSGTTAPVVRTIVVRDEQGRVVSVTKVAPDAKFGVGVEAPPGHTVTEFEAGTLAEDPFAAGGPGEPGTRSRQA